MAFYSFSGTTFHIGDSLAFKETDFVLSDFAGVSWTLVNDIESIGAYGTRANFGQFSSLGTRREYSYVTTWANEPAELVMARNSDDTGQQAILTASENPNNTYAIKFTYDDSGGVNPTTDYAIARFAPPRFDGGDNSSIMKWTAQLLISSNIVTQERA